MLINDSWKIEDGISGLKLEIRSGKALDVLHVETLDGSMNRDFWFIKKGVFDGIGSCISDKKSKELDEE